MYIYTKISTKKLSPTSLWVSKFDVKLGLGIPRIAGAGFVGSCADAGDGTGAVACAGKCIYLVP